MRADAHGAKRRVEAGGATKVMKRTGTREKAEGAAMGTILVHLPKKEHR